jgi:hypothetical protein
MCKRHASDYDETLPIKYKPNHPKKGDLQMLVKDNFCSEGWLKSCEF